MPSGKKRDELFNNEKKLLLVLITEGPVEHEHELDRAPHRHGLVSLIARDVSSPLMAKSL